jgi:hypothetical protein
MTIIVNQGDKNCCDENYPYTDIKYFIKNLIKSNG